MRYFGRRVAIVLLVAVDLALGAIALTRASDELSDGAGYVATGTTVLASIFVVLGLGTAAGFLKVPLDLRTSVQLVSFAGIAAHAGGLLFGWYAAFWWYDDLLHLVLPGVASVLLVRAAQAFHVFPPRSSTRARAAFLAITMALAVAAAWEIFEFGLGGLLHTQVQHDLVDTMRDMIAGGLGGVLASVWAAKHPRPRNHLRPERPHGRRGPSA